VEYKINGFVARDKNGNLYLYEKLPKRDRNSGYWITGEPFDKYFALPKEWFPEIKWQSEPLLIDITLNS